MYIGVISNYLTTAMQKVITPKTYVKAFFRLLLSDAQIQV